MLGVLIQGFTRKTHRTQCVVEAMINYRERMRSKISKGKRLMRQNLEGNKYKLPRVLSQWN